jgi:hypothetical protein
MWFNTRELVCCVKSILLIATNKNSKCVLVLKILPLLKLSKLPYSEAMSMAKAPSASYR